VFGSHDRFDGTEFCENDYVAWSTPLDGLSAWTCHGMLYQRPTIRGTATGACTCMRRTSSRALTGGTTCTAWTSVLC
jgi:hypothetical protein